MEQSTLIPFVRENLDILFVGLNPAKGSSCNCHYFSVNQSFWNQLYVSGLITCPIDKLEGDDMVFGGTSVNFHGWAYGITDLSPSFAESDSRKITPTCDECENLGQLGKLVPNCPTMFFNVAFPHGNKIKSEQKVVQYRKVRKYLCELEEK
jgi:hypothetical protein